MILKFKPLPPASRPPLTTEKKVWLLMPGGIPVEHSGRKGKTKHDISKATHWSYEGDELWTPIAQ